MASVTVSGKAYAKRVAKIHAILHELVEESLAIDDYRRCDVIDVAALNVLDALGIFPCDWCREES